MAGSLRTVEEIVWRSTKKVIARDRETGVERIVGPPEAVARTRVIDVTDPPAGLAPWLSGSTKDATANSAAMRALFEHINVLANTPGNKDLVFHVNIPPGHYYHVGVDLRDMTWPGYWANIHMQGATGFRRTILATLRDSEINFAFMRAWALVIRDITFYRGSHGLHLDTCQYLRITGCTFQQQKPSLTDDTASLYLKHCINLFIDDCHFVETNAAFIRQSGGRVMVNNCLVGESTAGAYASGGQLVIRNSTLFGMNSRHNDQEALFYLGTLAALTVQDCTLRLGAQIGKLIYAPAAPSQVIVQGCSITSQRELTLLAGGNLDKSDFPPWMMQDNYLQSPAAVTLAAFPAGQHPRNSIVSGNVFNFVTGTAERLTIPPEMLAPESNNIVDRNIVRATAQSY